MWFYNREITGNYKYIVLILTFKRISLKIVIESEDKDMINNCAFVES